MYKSEVFGGSFSGTTASDNFNEWIKDHQDIKIVEFGYQHARYGDHSICILYKDKDGDITDIIPSGEYEVQINNQKLIHWETQKDYGKYIKEWSIFHYTGLNEDFDHAFISFNHQDKSLLIFKCSIAQYLSNMRFAISEIFNIS